MEPATVFIIDQDAAVRDALSVTLRAIGFDVAAYSSAGDFLAMLPIRQKGCLLIELDLVDMTGPELVVRLSEERLSLPTIIMSAGLRMPVFERPRPAGIAAVLQKPFGQEELLTCLGRALGRSFDLGRIT